MPTASGGREGLHVHCYALGDGQLASESRIRANYSARVSVNEHSSDMLASPDGSPAE